MQRSFMASASQTEMISMLLRSEIKKMCSNLVGALFAFCIQMTMYGSAVADPFLNGYERRGVNLYLTETDVRTTATFERDVQNFLDRMEETGINSISLTWPLYTDNSISNSIYMGGDTLTPSSVQWFTQIARARGFGVWLHPILDERVLLAEAGFHWRGNITPHEVDSWFRDYRDLMAQYAYAAQAGGANGFIVATELWSMEPYHGHWEMVINAIREEFDGILSYASNRGIRASYFPWHLVDVIGINYFPNFEINSNASVESIVSAIQSDVDQIIADAADLGLPVMISEAGITSQQNALRITGKWNHRTAVDLDIQERYYQAICKSWAGRVDGIYWWNTVLYPIENAENDPYFNAVGKPAQAYMDCYSTS